jgi:uncharacterized membrane protein YpjA
MILMIKKYDIPRILGKYALIIIIVFFIQTIFGFAFDHYLKKQTIQNEMPILISFVPRALDLLLNIITAIIVFLDKKRFELKTRFLVFVTVVIGPLGVCLFLISLIYNLKSQEKKSAHNTVCTP